MQVVGVRSEFNKTTALHLTGLFPRDVALVQHIGLYPTAYDSYYRRYSVNQQEWEDSGVNTAVTVVDRYQDGAVGQRPPQLGCLIHVIKGNGCPSVSSNELE